MAITYRGQASRLNKIESKQNASGFQEKSSKCSVIEDISGQTKSCKFPFILRNETFYGCTSTGRNRSIVFITKMSK